MAEAQNQAVQEKLRLLDESLGEKPTAQNTPQKNADLDQELLDAKRQANQKENRRIVDAVGDLASESASFAKNLAIDAVKTADRHGRSISGNFFQGLLGDTVGGVVDLTAAGINLMLPEDLEITDPVGGSQDFQEGLEFVGLDPTTDSTSDALIRGTGAGFGAAAGLVGAAGRTGTAVEEAANQARRIGASPGKGAQAVTSREGAGRAIVETARKAPRATTTAETAAGAAGGAGGQAAHEAFPDDPMARPLGTLVGGVTPGTVSGVARGGRHALRNVRTSTSGQVRAEETLDFAIGSGDVDKIIRDIDEMDEFPHTLGTVVEGQGGTAQSIRQLERNLAQNDPAPFLSVRERQRTATEGLRPESDRTIADTQQTVRNQAEQLTGRMQQQVDKVAREVETLLDENSLTPDNRQIIKTKVRSIVEDALHDEREIEANKWMEFAALSNQEPAKSGLRVLQRNLETMLENKNFKHNTENVSKSKALAEEALAAMEEGDVDLETIQVLRSRALENIRKESRAGNNTDVGFLSQIEQSLFDVMRRTGSKPGQSAEAVKAWKEARRFSNNLNARFTHSVIGELRRKGKGHEELAEVFPRTLSDQQSARELVAAVGGREGLKEYANKWLVANFVDSNQKSADGSLSSERARRWVEKHKDVLDVFPEAKTAINQIISRRGRFEALSSRRRTADKILQDRAVRAFLDNDPDRIVGQIMNRKDRNQAMQKVVNRLSRDPDALAGFRDGVWDWIMKEKLPKFGQANQADAVFLSPAKAREVLQKNGDALKIALGEEQFNRVEKLVKWSDLMDKMAQGKIGGGSDTFQNQKSAITVPQILGRAYNVKRGVVSKFFVTSEAASRILNKFLGNRTEQEMRAILNDALTNPTTAKAMLKRIKSRRDALDVVTTLTDRLTGLTARTGVATEQSQEE